MSHGHLVRSFRERLNSLYLLCAQVAEQQGAQTESDYSSQEPFAAQMSTGGTAELPVMRITKDKVEVTLRPGDINSDLQGGYYATLSVDRKLLGASRLNSPRCWTDVNDPADPHWYAGVVPNKSTQVDAAMITSWLHHSGPALLW